MPYQCGCIANENRRLTPYVCLQIILTARQIFCLEERIIEGQHENKNAFLYDKKRTLSYQKYCFNRLF